MKLPPEIEAMRERLRFGASEVCTEEEVEIYNKFLDAYEKAIALHVIDEIHKRVETSDRKWDISVAWPWTRTMEEMKKEMLDGD